MIRGHGRKWLPFVFLAIAAIASHNSARPQERHISQAEARDITKILEILPGDVVADVGAGYGGWTVELARRVQNEGHIFATEVDSDRLEDIRETIADAGLTNVSLVWGSQKNTGLPPRCCDAILLRRVYHHFTKPEAMRDGLRRALRNDGVILVIDFEPGTRNWLKRPEDVPKNREGHGISRRLLIEEMSSVGFEVAREVSPWHGRDYCILFRARPESEVTTPSQ